MIGRFFTDHGAMWKVVRINRHHLHLWDAFQVDENGVVDTSSHMIVSKERIEAQEVIPT